VLPNILKDKLVIMTIADFTCQELVELVTAYIEGALPIHERTRFEAHLAVCRGCTTYLEQMRQTITLLGTLSETTMSPQARDDLLVAFQRWKQP
jgi:anti-sigma factor RsiW